MFVSHRRDKSSSLHFVYLPADSLMTTLGFPGGSVSKESARNAGHLGLVESFRIKLYVCQVPDREERIPGKASLRKVE